MRVARIVPLGLVYKGSCVDALVFVRVENFSVAIVMRIVPSERLLEVSRAGYEEMEDFFGVVASLFGLEEVFYEVLRRLQVRSGWRYKAGAVFESMEDCCDLFGRAQAYMRQ